MKIGKIVKTEPDWEIEAEINGEVKKWEDNRPLGEILRSYLKKAGKKLPDKKKLV